MSEAALFELADRAGLVCVWHDVFGAEHRVSPDTLRALLAVLGFETGSEAACRDGIARIADEARVTPDFIAASKSVDIVLPGNPGRFRIVHDDGSVFDGFVLDAGDGLVRIPGVADVGYHRLEFGANAIGLAVAPPRAFTIADALGNRHAGEKAWGVAVQVYSLRRDDDGGIGDFATLARFADIAGRRGADAIAISPVHALFAGDPGHYSPYAPSSRIAPNPVYAPVSCRDAPAGPVDLIDWPIDVARRLDALRAAFARDRDDPAFQDFLSRGADVFRHHAVFEAISADRQKLGAGRDWRFWPEALRLPESEDMRRFIGQNRDEIAFHLYAQWRARTGLCDAQKAARDSGMAIGLIADLAVGVDPAGSDAWSRQGEMLGGVAIGAPPDEFNRCGQNWGLTTFSPRGLRRSGFSALRDMLAAAFAATGGVRIDHAMGLARLWLIPDGAEPGEGCYLRFPFDDMRRIVMLESARHRGIVLAEDLGTVPGGFRETLAESGFSGMSVLWFERDGDRFVPPAHWRAETVAMTTTHDLPTVAGWWRGTDVAWRDRLGIAGEGAEKRAWDRGCLWSACRESGAAADDMPAPEEGDAIADAVIAHVATARSALVILPAEDILALDEQPNIPGTTDEHPNWRRRLPGDAAALLEQSRVADRLARLDRARRRSG